MTSGAASNGAENAAADSVAAESIATCAAREPGCLAHVAEDDEFAVDDDSSGEISNSAEKVYRSNGRRDVQNLVRFCNKRSRPHEHTAYEVKSPVIGLWADRSPALSIPHEWGYE